jgi:hypothetical protein
MVALGTPPGPNGQTLAAKLFQGECVDDTAPALFTNSGPFEPSRIFPADRVRRRHIQATGRPPPVPHTLCPGRGASSIPAT